MQGNISEHRRHQLWGGSSEAEGFPFILLEVLTGSVVVAAGPTTERLPSILRYYTYDKVFWYLFGRPAGKLSAKRRHVCSMWWYPTIITSEKIMKRLTLKILYQVLGILVVVANITDHGINSFVPTIVSAYHSSRLYELRPGNAW